MIIVPILLVMLTSCQSAETDGTVSVVSGELLLSSDTAVSSEISSSGEEAVPVLTSSDEPEQSDTMPDCKAPQAKKMSFKSLDCTIVSTDAVNVRADATTSSTILGILPKDSNASAVGICDDKWYMILYRGSYAFVIADSFTVEGAAEQETSSEKTTPEEKAGDGISNLKVTDQTSQLIIVAVDGKKATVSMYNESSDGKWSELFTTDGYVSKNGISADIENSGKTPTGVFGLSTVFGVKMNPGASGAYIRLDSTHYWVTDIESAYYNQFVSSNSVVADWNSSIHLIDNKSAYAYTVAVDYNPQCAKNKAAAVFLQCTVKNSYPKNGISIPEEYMIEVLKNLSDDCLIVIDKEEKISSY